MRRHGVCYVQGVRLDLEIPMKRLSLLALLALSACVPSEDQVQQEWDAFVSENNSCETVDDCVVVYPGCPLGCGTAVSASAEAEARALGESLIAEYERGGQECLYDCAGFEPACESGACVAVVEDTGM